VSSVEDQHDVSPAPDWPQEIQNQMRKSAMNGCVGQKLVSENNRVRVWSIRLLPGQRIGFHRHVLDYFWTAVTAGKARSYRGDGTINNAVYREGETQHLRFGLGEFMVHDLENVGDTELVFTTVEFLDSANRPLPVPAAVRD
jgi:quercetin dioxygenase-like cupin family protein